MPTETDRKQIDPNEMDQQIPRNEAPPLEFYPEREWIHAKVEGVEYRYVYRNGQQQFVQNKDGEDIYDKETLERIPRKEFNISMVVHDYQLPNGDSRKAWLSLGASMSDRAHLPQVLSQFGYTKEDPTPNEIKNVFLGREVVFQVVNKKRRTDGKEYQAVIWDSLKPVNPKDNVAWDE